MNTNNLDTKNPYLMVVGCPRSGTTLLQRMINSHPLIVIENDVDFIIKGVSKNTKIENPEVNNTIIAKVKNTKRFKNLGIKDDVYETISSKADTYREFVSSIYDEFGIVRNKPLAGEKSARYIKYIDFIGELLPWTKFVHIIRDGRDVTLSALDWANNNRGPGRMSLWSEEPIAVSALWWKWQVSLGIKYKNKTTKNNYYELKYEDLVGDSETTLKALTDYLGVPYENSMIEFYVGKTKNDPGLSAKSAWIPATKGLRDWRNSLSERDIELFEAIAGDLLELLGYELMFKKTSSALKKVRESSVNWWTNELSRPFAQYS